MNTFLGILVLLVIGLGLLSGAKVKTRPQGRPNGSSGNGALSIISLLILIIVIVGGLFS